MVNILKIQEENNKALMNELEVKDKRIKELEEELHDLTMESMEEYD